MCVRFLVVICFKATTTRSVKAKALHMMDGSVYSSVDEDREICESCTMECRGFEMLEHIHGVEPIYCIAVKNKHEMCR